MNDTMTITILPDGTIKVDTGVISQANHLSAEAFVAQLAKLTGGPVEVRHKDATHAHGHTHSHGEELHQH